MSNSESAALAALSQALFDLADGLRIVKFSCLGALVFVLYDYFLTFPREVEYVWKQAWSYGKILYFLNRYLGLGVIILDTVVGFSSGWSKKVRLLLSVSLVIPVKYPLCSVGYLHAHLALTITILLLVQIILISRLYAVYERGWRITMFSIAICICTTTTSFVIDYLAGAKSTDPHTSTINCVLFDKHTSILRIHLAADSPFGDYALSIDGVQGVQLIQARGGIENFKNYGQRQFALFLKASQKFVLFVLLANVFIWAFGPEKLNQVVIPYVSDTLLLTTTIPHAYLEPRRWADTVPCAMGSCLLLNIRHRYLNKSSVLSLVTGGVTTETSPPSIDPHTFLSNRDEAIHQTYKLQSLS
ncbi:hypothetical protein M422DRAFT_255077 [Sphaerobolus stellatus SS14]|uniref:DUF6533 domain-containing protein n=1 Tax=Sphaerobolus stellatus (strain SS14) TaxID=990650 RepID=A0A0C9VJH8_SPHS4|nr:hypothetical protein M422DRAFT_255077 [Sphaerobolus stellatus SS14]